MSEAGFTGPFCGGVAGAISSEREAGAVCAYHQYADAAAQAAARAQVAKIAGRCMALGD